jgi:hypothetical protein
LTGRSSLCIERLSRDGHHESAPSVNTESSGIREQESAQWLDARGGQKLAEEALVGLIRRSDLLRFLAADVDARRSGESSLHLAAMTALRAPWGTKGMFVQRLTSFLPGS